MRGIEVTRRGAIGALAGGALWFVLAGPGRERKRRDGRVVLDYWEKWTGQEGAAMEAIVDAFNQSQSRVWVRYLATAGVSEKAMISIAGGASPDLVGLYGHDVPQFAESGAITALDELPGGESLSPERYAGAFRGFVRHADRDGRERAWGVVSSGGTLALYWNKARFAEAGLPGPPRTAEELDTAHDRLTEVRGGRIVRAGFVDREPGWWSWVFGPIFGGRVWDPESWRSELSGEGSVRAYQWVQDRATRHGVSPMKQFRSGFGNYDSPRNAFLAGEVAMVLQGPWLANIIGAYAGEGFEYGVAPMPASGSIRDDGAPVGAAEADVVVVPRGVKDPGACVEFLRFCQERENLERLSLAHFKNSPLAESSEGFRSLHPNRGLAAFDAVAKSPRSFTTPRTRAWPEIKREMDAMMDPVCEGNEPASAVLARVDRRVQAVLDRQTARRRRRGWPVPGGAGGPA